VKDRINEKRLPIPSKKTCWDIHLHLLEMPASVATPPAKMGEEEGKEEVGQGGW